MTTLQDLVKNGNPVVFTGIVGKAGVRETRYGSAIDVADNSVRPCRWIDVIPDDPQLVGSLIRGDLVEIRGVILVGGKRPLVYGTVTVLRG